MTDTKLVDVIRHTDPTAVFLPSSVFISEAEIQKERECERKKEDQRCVGSLPETARTETSESQDRGTQLSLPR